MATNWVDAVTGHLPTPASEDENNPKDPTLYIPVAMLAYIGYFVGFETVVDISIPTTQVVLTATYYEPSGDTSAYVRGAPDELPRVELKALLLLAVVVGLMCVSVQEILATKLYARIH